MSDNNSRSDIKSDISSFNSSSSKPTFQVRVNQTHIVDNHFQISTLAIFKLIWRKSHASQTRRTQGKASEANDYGFKFLHGRLLLIIMAEAKHAVISLKSIQSEPQIAKTSGLAAPAHSRSNSSDSGEGLLLSASDLQARSAYPVPKLNNNNIQKSEVSCCDIKVQTDAKRQPKGAMGQSGNNTAKSNMDKGFRWNLVQIDYLR